MTGRELRQRLTLIWESPPPLIRTNAEKLCHELHKETQMLTSKLEAADRERDIAQEESRQATAEVGDLKIELQRALQLLRNSEMECRRLKDLVSLGWDEKSTEVATSIIDHMDDEAPDEAAVQYFLEKIRKGEHLKTPALTEDTNAPGTYLVVDGRARIEAAKRVGAKTIPAYVIKGLTPEQLCQLRKDLNQFRLGNE